MSNGQIEGDKTTVTMDVLKRCLGKKSLLYDKKGEEHYNLISALHKSMRNSDPDAGGLLAGPDAGGRRGSTLRGPQAYPLCQRGYRHGGQPRPSLAVAAYEACHFLGMPECNVNLSHAVIYLAMAPKSNAAYVAYEEAKADAQNMLAEPVPLNIRNAPTNLMKQLHYGEGYVYAHDTEEKMARMQCLPDSLLGRTYYRPNEAGKRDRQKSGWRRSAAGRMGKIREPGPQEGLPLQKPA